MIFTLNIAYRFLTSKKGQTILIIVGFGLGIAVNIFVGSLIQSLQGDLLQSTIGTQPHITITNSNETVLIENYESIISSLDEIEGLDNVATALDIRAFITNINPESPDDIIMRGFELEDANDIYGFYRNFNGSKPESNNEIIIGIDMSKKLNVNIGDELEIKFDPNPLNIGENMEITGIFDLGVSTLNDLWVISNFDNVEKIANVSNVVNSINIQVDNVFDADKLAIEIKNILSDDNLIVENWKETNESLLSGLDAQSSSTTIIQVFVLMSVVVGIASILSITILQKSRQIGILKAMGLTNLDTALVFLWEGIMLGTFGAILGVLFAYGMLYGFNEFAAANNPDLFTIIVDSNFLIQSIVVAIIASMLASVLPARTSSKMEVIDIIRNN